MPRGRDSHIRLDDFLSLWATKVGHNSTTASMRRYLVGFQNVILEQLKLNDEVYVHNFGTFYLRNDGGTIRRMGDMKTKGKTVERFITPRISIVFNPSATLERAVNENDFEFVPKKSTKKYTTKKEAKDVYNKKRQKPKKCFDELFCEITNEINDKNEKKNEDNNET